MVSAVEWPVVVAIAVVLAVVCFLAVLWSRREWKSRKIRMGVFLEREYRNTDQTSEDTAEWSTRKD